MRKKAALLEELQCQMELLKNLTALQELRKKPSPVEIPSGPVGGAMDTMETMPMCLEEHFDKHLDVQARLQKKSKHIKFFTCVLPCSKWF